MLNQLIIKNLAIVENLKLDFKDKLTILTGETGAGKSIILSSINLLLGGKAKQEIIRNGCDKADIIGTFNLDNLNYVKNQLIETDLISKEDSECILRRTLNKEGKSVCYINDIRVSSNMLKNIGEQLIDIHGQHANQLLLKRKNQLNLVDEYINNPKLLEEVKENYRNWKHVKDKLFDLKNNFEENHAKKELLSYQYQELEELNLVEGEVPLLEEELKNLESAHSILTCGGNALNIIDNEEFSIISALSNTLNLIQEINKDNKELNNIEELLNSAQIEIEEAKNSLDYYLNKIEINPEKLSQIEERLNKIYKLSKKHYETPENLFFFQNILKEELNKLNVDDKDLEELEIELNKTKEKYINSAKKLSKLRTLSIKNMIKEVNDVLISLSLPKDMFNIYLETYEESENNFSEIGLDIIDFYISPNKGEKEKLLNEIASGGELSRISLAIQVVALKNKKIPTMIFDEVDTGISGETANVVGELLSNLSLNGQVLCITHLPQVASKGHQHYFVSKKTLNNKTYSQIEELSLDDRIKEIAQMLGGKNITKESWEHAKQLLNKE